MYLLDQIGLGATSIAASPTNLSASRFEVINHAFVPDIASF